MEQRRCRLDRRGRGLGEMGRPGGGGEGRPANGRHDCRWRRGRGPGRAALPTLLITGETAPDPLRRVRDAGLPVLFKPVAAPALLDALARAMHAQGHPQ